MIAKVNSGDNYRGESRYGGWTIAQNDGQNADLGATLDNMIVWYNNKAPHALPSYLNAVSNAMLRNLAKEAGEDSSRYGITTFSQPIDASSGLPTSETM